MYKISNYYRTRGSFVIRFQRDCKGNLKRPSTQCHWYPLNLWLFFVYITWNPFESFWKKNMKVFYWKNEFIEQTILLNNIVYWKNELNRWEKNDNFKNERNNIFERKKEKNGSFTNDIQTKWKKRTRPSLPTNPHLYLLKFISTY